MTISSSTLFPSDDPQFSSSIVLLCVPHPRCRYLEVRYHRPEEIHKGRLIESRVENIVVFLPDIAAACMPSSLEWEETLATYKQACDEEIAEELNEVTLSVHISSLIFFSLTLSCVHSRHQIQDHFLSLISSAVE